MIKRRIRLLASLAVLASIVGMPTFARPEQDTDVKALSQFAARQKALYKRQKTEAIRLAKLLGLPIRVEDNDGTVKELMRFVNGEPLYYQTCNLGAARTVSANTVWEGGSTGFNLSGKGVILGEWDAGCALVTHQEMTGRAINMDDSMPAEHSAHVGGTMIAAGIDPLAKGMSYAATLHTYDWADDSSEMAVEAANGLRVSSHSYGSWGPIEYYGEYDSGTASRDELANYAPYLLICQAAGNMQGANPGKDGYETLIIPACAKNVLTVAAVNKNPAGYSGPASVSMSSFSSWGPTDDGRIKPDISTPGVDLYSCSSLGDDKYVSMSGTSMATPCMSGNLGLLIEHFSNTHIGRKIKAATLKAIVIHNADEAGDAPGPDYRFGWGQLNTKSCAEFITGTLEDPERMQEHTLTQGQVYTYTGVATGEPIKVTIVWSDPAGEAQETQDDPTPRLVNDLDLRVTSGGTVYKPWVLNPFYPALGATTGDNNLDNVEQVVAPAGTGLVTIKVTNKSAFLKPFGYQDFSIVITGVESPKLTGFYVAPVPIIGGITTQGHITISTPAPTGGAAVYLSTDAPKSYAKVASKAYVPEGKTEGTFNITTYIVTVPKEVTVTATYGNVSIPSTFTINNPGIVSLTLDQEEVTGGETVTGDVTIGMTAPYGGSTVRVASNNTKVASLDWRVLVPAGSLTAPFTVQTKAVKKPTTVVIRGGFPGPTKYVSLLVLPQYKLSTLTLSANSVKGGYSVVGTVSMTTAAKTDTVVTLASSNTGIATVPASVTIPAGSSSVTFSVVAKSVSAAKTVNVSATYGSDTKTIKLKVKK
jgi:hypothetical protein